MSKPVPPGSVPLRIARLLMKLAVAFLVFFPPLTGAFTVLWRGARIDSTPRDYGIDYRDVQITTNDGLHLPGWIVPVEKAKPAKGAMLLLHGHPANRLDVLEKAQFLSRAGYTCLLFDFRAHGNAEGRLTYLGLEEWRDVRAALDVLVREAPGLPIGMFGQSFGAAVAILSAKKCPEVRSFILDSPFASFYQRMVGEPGRLLKPLMEPMRYLQLWWACRFLGRPWTDIAPEAVVQDLKPRPVFFIHGEADQVVLPEQGKRLYNLYEGPKEQWLIPGCYHIGGHVLHRAEYERRVLAFLARSLQAAAPGGFGR